MGNTVDVNENEYAVAVSNRSWLLSVDWKQPLFSSAAGSTQGEFF
jgi:hypothetical protein